MVCSGNTACVFWKGSAEYIRAAVSGSGVEDALAELEKLCREQKRKKAILIEPEMLEHSGCTFKKVTLDDIARKVGCSRAAVSYAMRGNHPISPELRMKILTELERCNYRPSVGRQKKSGKTVVILGHLSGSEYNGPAVIAKQLFEKGYTPILTYLPLYEPLCDTGKRTLAHIRDLQNAAGIISLHPHVESFDILRYSQQLPVIIHNRPQSMLSESFFDFTAAGELAALTFKRHKFCQGAFINYGETGTCEYRQLWAGLTKFKELSFVSIPIAVKDCNHLKMDSLLDDAYNNGCRCFFAQSAVLCSLIMRWAEKKHINIPEELSLIYLDQDNMAEDLRPQATSIVVPNRKLLNYSVEALISKIESRPQEEKIIHPWLVDKNTVGFSPLGEAEEK